MLVKRQVRAFSFLKDNEILDRIVFFHVQSKKEISDNLYADLHGNVEKIDEQEVIYFSNEAKEEFKKADIEIKYKQHRIGVLKSILMKKSIFCPHPPYIAICL